MIVFFLSILLNLLLILALAAFIYLLFRLVTQPSSLTDRFLLAAMVLIGAMTDLAFNAAGLSVAGSMVQGLSGASGWLLTFATLLAGGVGIGVGWIVTRRRLWRDKKRVVRILIYLGTIATIEFILIYAQTLREEGLALGPSIVPNVAFVVCVILYLALASDPDAKVTIPRRRGHDGPFIPR